MSETSVTLSRRRFGREREEAVAALLAEREATIPEVAEALGISAHAVEGAFKRLRMQGVPIVSVRQVTTRGRGRRRHVFRIVYDAGRRCAHEGCITILSASNPGPRCYRHSRVDEPLEDMHYHGQSFGLCRVCGEVRERRHFAAGEVVCKRCDSERERGRYAERKGVGA